jgi:glutathione S-transferase
LSARLRGPEARRRGDATLPVSRTSLEAAVITLYGPRRSPFTEKIVLGLALKKLEFTLVEPTDLEDYRRWSPTGKLPAIDIDGERVADSTAILLRLEALVPQPPLLAEDPRIAEKQLALVHWVDETFLWYWDRWVRRPGHPQTDGPFVMLAGESLAEAERRSQAGGPAAPDPRPSAEERRLVEELSHRVADLARLLGPRPFFYADRIGLADLAAYSILKSLAEDTVTGTRRHLERQPALLAFMQRVEQETRS